MLFSHMIYMLVSTMELFWGTRNSWTQPGHEVVLQQVGWWLILKRNTIVWVNYNDLTATSLEMMVSRGDYPQMTLNSG
jgi:phospholipase/lecithinase/hemolysin